MTVCYTAVGVDSSGMQLQKTGDQRSMQSSPSLSMDSCCSHRRTGSSHVTARDGRSQRQRSRVRFRLRMFSEGLMFTDRHQAGEKLGAELRERLRRHLGQEQQQLAVFGLVRGGLPVAEPVARALDAPLDAFVVRKIGAPLQPEFGIGAISEGGHTIINEAAVHAVGATVAQLQHTIREEDAELQRRIAVYRGGQDHLPVAGKTVVVVDDGLATGITARAALQALKCKGAAKLVLAVPVGSAGTVKDLTAAQLADEIVCLSQPRHFRAVGQWFEDFNQTTDAEVVSILAKFETRNAAYRAAAAPAHSPAPMQASPGSDAAAAAAGKQTTAARAPAGHVSDEAQPEPCQPPSTSTPVPAAPRDQFQSIAATAAATGPAAAAATAGMEPTTDEEIVITDAATPGARLHGTLNVPVGAKGLVVFAHGSGSSRNSPRNRQVAATLNRAGFATLLFDLLSAREAQNTSNVFNIPLLASRLQLAVEWMEITSKLPSSFPVGFFGASTGGGAALWAAAYLDDRVSAVIVRGGRPDLASEKLPAVKSPTLLLVGGADVHVLNLNYAALQLLGAAEGSELVEVAGAGHLFEGPGQLEEVADKAVQWFAGHMG